jgi:2-hydroxy-3-keto-5-methylthiopentenyl-1-phosphate phosphatase
MSPFQSDAVVSECLAAELAVGLGRGERGLAELAQPIVFCDFDGTITQEDTFVAVANQLVPEVWGPLQAQLYAFEITLHEAVSRMVAAIPARHYPAIVAAAKCYGLRSGFGEFVQFLQGVAVPLVVVSGGLQDVVEAALEDYRPGIKGIHAAQIDSSGEFLRIHSAYESASEMVAKARVMADYVPPGGSLEAVLIGDSITDLELALQVPLVFARDRLAQYLRERDRPYVPWQDFGDVQAYLSEGWVLAR